MIADDTNVFYVGNNPDLEASDINKGLLTVGTWGSLNKRTLNVDKTNFIVFKIWQNKLDLTKQLHINNISIAKTTEIVSGYNHRYKPELVFRHF